MYILTLNMSLAKLPDVQRMVLGLGAFEAEARWNRRTSSGSPTVLPLGLSLTLHPRDYELLVHLGNAVEADKAYPPPPPTPTPSTTTIHQGPPPGKMENAALYATSNQV